MASKKNTQKSRNVAKAGKAAQAMKPRFGLSGNAKLTLGVLIIAAAMLGAAIVSTNRDTASTNATSADQRLVRPDSHRLSTAADGKVTVVEFLDFECEACGAAYPDVEKLRAEYNNKITYVVRYFPLGGHLNAQPAARAAQAAANQGKFEAMYVKLFETQTSWGDQQRDHTATFEGFAGDIGLDLDRYRADLAAPATAERIRTDQADGEALGVQSTPTFFINGERFTGRPTYDSLKAAVSQALAS